jgi:hypothetical protein
VYIYYQKSYEAHDDMRKRSRHARAKRIIQRAAHARRARRRRGYVAGALQRLIPGSEQFGGMGLGVEDTVSNTIATRPRICFSGASLLAASLAPVAQGAATIGSPGRARWGASGSLNPQSALAGLNPLPRGSRPRHGLRVRALTVRSRAL